MRGGIQAKGKNSSKKKKRVKTLMIKITPTTRRGCQGWEDEREREKRERDQTGSSRRVGRIKDTEETAGDGIER